MNGKWIAILTGLVLLLPASSFAQQRTRVVLVGGERLDGELLSFRKYEGLRLLTGLDTLHIDWKAYRTHRTLRRDLPLPRTGASRSRDSLRQRYPTTGKTLFHSHQRKHRYYVGASFMLKDQLTAVSSYGPHVGLLLELGWRYSERLAFSAIVGTEQLQYVSREPVFMLGGQYRIRNRLSTPYVSYHLGYGRNKYSWLNPARQPRGGWQQALTLGFEYGRYTRLRPYIALSYRTYRSEFFSATDLRLGSSLNHQQYLGYEVGIRF